MAIYVNEAGAAVARAIKSAGLFFAVGNGATGWDELPASEDPASSVLVSLVGARAADLIQYCLPDEEGEINVSSGRYAASETPTRYLYVRATFDEPDAAGETLREAAVYVGLSRRPEVPPSQYYLSPADILDVGTLMLLNHFTAIPKTGDFSFTLDFVLSL